MKEKIDFKEAIRILHPETTAVALKEYEYYGGFNGHRAAIEAINEASILACEAMRKQVPIEHHHTKIGKFHEGDRMRISVCPDCLALIYTYADEFPEFCNWCGQAIDWSDENE